MARTWLMEMVSAAGGMKDGLCCGGWRREMYEGERDNCFEACCHGWEGGRPSAEGVGASESVVLRSWYWYNKWGPLWKALRIDLVDLVSCPEVCMNGDVALTLA